MSKIESNITGEVLINPIDTIEYNTSYIPTGLEPVGTRYWDAANGTTTLVTSTGSKLQDGQETRYWGKASGNILNGEWVQFAGSQGDHVLFKKVVPAEVITNPRLLMGIATEDIANGSYGNITKFGYVNDVNTTGWSVNDILYWDNTTGQATNVMPEAPERMITIAAVIKEETSPAAKNGILLVRISWGQKLTELEDVDGVEPFDRSRLEFDAANNYWNPTANLDAVTYDSTGVPADQRANFTLDYDHATQCLTLTKINNWYYWIQGERVLVDSTIVCTPHDNAYGVYFYYINDNAKTMTITTTPWTIEKNQVLIALVLYNPNAQSTIKGFALEERHGLRDLGWHYNKHFGEGTTYISGGAVADFVLDTDTVAATTWSATATLMADEDVKFTTAAQADGSNYTILFQNASNQWDWYTGQSLPYIISNNNITYNPIGSGLVEVTTTNRYFNLYHVAVPAVSSTFQNVIMVGKTLYTSKELADGEDFNVVFPRTGFLPEYCPVAQFDMWYQIGNSTTTGKSKIAGFRYIRGQVSISGTAPTNVHNNLAGLQGGVAPDYFHSNQPINTTDSPTFTGMTLSGLTAGSIMFLGNSGIVSQDNAGLFWDNTNKRLGIGTTTPTNQHTTVSSGDAMAAGITGLQGYYFSTVISTGQGAGVGFGTGNTIGNNNVGAKIVHIRNGAQSQGHLAFFTKPNTTIGDTSTEKMRILDNGNIGIGLTNPANKLTVLSSGTSTNPFVIRNAANTLDLMYLRESSTGNGEFNFRDLAGTVDIQLRSGGLSSFIRAGDVGIGTVTPSEKLDVVGNIKASGIITSSDSRNISDGTITRDSNDEVSTVALAGRTITFNRDINGVLLSYEDANYLWTLNRTGDLINGWVVTTK
jgi:hypothetical protein